MNLAQSFPVAAVVLALVGCSSSKSNSGAQAPEGDAGAIADPLSFTMKVTVAAGAEIHECQYVTLPPSAGFIVGGSHTYTPGSHHLLLFRTDLTSIPAGQDGLRDCYEAGGTMMSHIRGVVYGSQEASGNLTMPDGVGLPYKAGDVLLFQSHYLNASAKPIDAEVDIHLRGATDGITTHAGVLFYYAPFIHVPIGAKSRAGMRCTVRQNITLFTAGSHYHKRGVDYEAYIDPPSASPTTVPFYTSTDWDHPASLSAPTAIAAGSHLRYGCGYDNTAGTKEYFQGQSAENDEMCMFVGLYYPEMTDDDDNCYDADSFGAGTNACAAASSCALGCPAGTSPLGDASGNIDPCWQKCFADSCPSASTPLIAQLECIGQQCKTECAGGGNACGSCALAKCANEVSACQQHTCAQ